MQLYVPDTENASALRVHFLQFIRRVQTAKNECGGGIFDGQAPGCFK